MEARNEIVLYGPVSRGPETRDTKNKKIMVTFSIETNPGGRKKPEISFEIPVVLFDALATEAEGAFNQGDWVLVEGRLQVRAWKNREGHWQRSPSVVASSFKLVEKGSVVVPEDQPEEAPF